MSVNIAPSATAEPYSGVTKSAERPIQPKPDLVAIVLYGRMLSNFSISHSFRVMVRANASYPRFLMYFSPLSDISVNSAIFE